MKALLKKFLNWRLPLLAIGIVTIYWVSIQNTFEELKIIHILIHNPY